MFKLIVEVSGKQEEGEDKALFLFVRILRTKGSQQQKGDLPCLGTALPTDFLSPSLHPACG